MSRRRKRKSKTNSDQFPQLATSRNQIRNLSQFYLQQIKSETRDFSPPTSLSHAEEGGPGLAAAVLPLDYSIKSEESSSSAGLKEPSNVEVAGKGFKEESKFSNPFGIERLMDTK